MSDRERERFFRRLATINTLHGMRVTAAVRLAEAGASEIELMKTFGWKTSRQACHYTREASKATIIDNAMRRWESADRRAA